MYCKWYTSRMELTHLLVQVTFSQTDVYSWRRGDLYCRATVFTLNRLPMLGTGITVLLGAADTVMVTVMVTAAAV